MRFAVTLVSAFTVIWVPVTVPTASVCVASLPEIRIAPWGKPGRLCANVTAAVPAAMTADPLFLVG